MIGYQYSKPSNSHLASYPTHSFRITFLRILIKTNLFLAVPIQMLQVNPSLLNNNLMIMFFFSNRAYQSHSNTILVMWVTMPTQSQKSIDTLRLKLNGQHFADNIFRSIFLEGISSILIQIPHFFAQFMSH